MRFSILQPYINLTNSNMKIFWESIHAWNWECMILFCLLANKKITEIGFWNWIMRMVGNPAQQTAVVAQRRIIFFCCLRLCNIFWHSIFAAQPFVVPLSLTLTDWKLDLLSEWTTAEQDCYIVEGRYLFQIS